MRWILLAVLFAGLPAHAQKTEKAIFAAGCFWCTEEAFEHVPGVVSAVSGYTGGSVKNPSYEQVSGGRTGHAEAVEVIETDEVTLNISKDEVSALPAIRAHRRPFS